MTPVLRAAMVFFLAAFLPSGARAGAALDGRDSVEPAVERHIRGEQPATEDASMAEVDYDDGVRLSQAHVNQCREAVASLGLSEDELRNSCGSEGDNVGRGTIAVRISAGRGFSACVRGFQRLYRAHAPSRTRHFAAGGENTDPAFLMNCAYMSTRARRAVARASSSAAQCLARPIAAGRSPHGLSESIRRCVGRRNYGINAAFTSAPPRHRTPEPVTEPAVDPATGGGDSAVEVSRAQPTRGTKRRPASERR